jgi:hypothetical protein
MKVYWPEWLTNLFKRPPKVNKYSDFIHYNSNGSISVDYWGWWKTPEGQKAFKEDMEKMRKFEAECRARDPEGKFTFYD